LEKFEFTGDTFDMTKLKTMASREKWVALLVVMGGLGAAHPAHALFHLTATGIGNVGNTANTVTAAGITSYTTVPSFSIGGGVLAEITVKAMLGLETGYLSVPHAIATTVISGTPTTGTVSFTHGVIPLLLRFRFLPLISLGTGVYYGLASTQLTSNFGGTVTTTTLNPDYGLHLSAAFHWPIIPLFKGRFDLRYQYGLANVASGAGYTMNTRDLLLGLGLEFDL